MSPDRNIPARIAFTAGVTTVIFGLYLTSLHSYLLFHGLIEITTVSIGFTLFILTWNVRSYLANDYLKLLGIGYAFIALIDLTHTLAYKGMNVFPGYGANLPTQLWVAARYLQAVTLFAAPFFVERRLSTGSAIGGYAVAVSLLVAAVFFGIFPDCFIEDRGLTSFKIVSEYVITALLFASLFLLYKKRSHFDKRVLFLAMSSIALTAFSEISFTAYISVYGFVNLLGHYFKLAAFYLVYRAILVTGLREPFNLIFRELEETRDGLRKARDNLEEQVRERTIHLEEATRSLEEEIAERKRAEDELRLSESRYRTAQAMGRVGNWEYNLQTGRFWGSDEAKRIYGFDPEQDDFSTDEVENCVPEREQVHQALIDLIEAGKPYNMEFRIFPKGSSKPKTIASIAELQRDECGVPLLVVGVVQDITERKHAEEAINRMNRELRAITDCNETLMRATDEETLLNDICRIICDEAGYHMAWVGLVEHDDARTIRPVAWAGVEDGYLATVNITWADTERGRGPTGTAVRSGTTACIQDFIAEPVAAPWRENALQRGYLSSTALPLKGENGAVFGVLNIYSTESNVFTPDEIRLLEELAGDLAFGINVLRTRDERFKAQESITLLSFALDNVRDAAFLIDEKARFHFVNERSCHVLGYARAELLSLGVPDIDPDFPTERWPSHWEELKANLCLVFEGRHKTKDGRIFPVEISANYFEYGDTGYNLALARDITSRKQAEDQVRHLKNYLSNIIDSMPSILVGIDNAYTVTQWNRQAEEFTGIPAQEAIGKEVSYLLPDFSPWIMTMGKDINEHHPASMEKLLIEKGGERRFYDLMLYPLTADGMEGAVLRIEDVTERARIQELMVQTEKMMSLGGLAAGMAHEINNPLGIIIQAAQNIERRVSPDLPANRKAAEESGVDLEGMKTYFARRQIPEFIGSIREASLRASRIIANMLRFSRSTETTMQPASLPVIIDQALELAASDYDLKKKYDFRSIEIVKDYQDIPQIPMVSVEIEQVILNLLKNAAQAMIENPPEKKPVIALRLRREDRYALLEIEDNGPGMTEEIRRRVFEPFYTTKDPGIGTGLGLSVSYMIITQNHKGLMEVESIPGRGSCFKVRLPAAGDWCQPKSSGGNHVLT